MRGAGGGVAGLLEKKGKAKPMPSLNAETENERGRRAALPKQNFNSLQSHKEANWRLLCDKIFYFQLFGFEGSSSIVDVVAVGGGRGGGGACGAAGS